MVKVTPLGTYTASRRMMVSSAPQVVSPVRAFTPKAIVVWSWITSTIFVGSAPCENWNPAPENTKALITKFKRGLSLFFIFILLEGTRKTSRKEVWRHPLSLEKNDRPQPHLSDVIVTKSAIRTLTNHLQRKSFFAMMTPHHSGVLPHCFRFRLRRIQRDHLQRD